MYHSSSTMNKILSIASLLAALLVRNVSAQQPELLQNAFDAIDGKGVPVAGGWNNKLIGGDNVGQYFLFLPEHWLAVFGSFPEASELSGATYEVRWQRNGQTMGGATVRVWKSQESRPEIGIPVGFEHGRFDPFGESAKGQWQTGDVIYPLVGAENDGGGNTGGDPHFTTWSNEHYEYHGQCDLTLVKDADFIEGKGLDIQIRTKVVRFWSYIKSVAIKIGDDILEIEGSPNADDAEAHYWINYEYQGDLDTFAGFPVTQELPSVYKRHYIIKVNESTSIVVQLYKEFVRVKFNGDQSVFGNTIGLLGNYKTGQLLARDGSTVMDDFAEFGDEWQVLPSEPRLFHEVSEPQFPELCIKPEDPRGERKRRLAESSISIEAAEAACGSALTDPLTIKDCVYDILATQDLDMVGAF
ncbi:unnamed protein product [Cylindrotheca closterium]|uniref:VWFD domain-containing protein n=1 Tax=Cylindrotheca closterium TaxID=2856 RepID=A0AAD2FNK7_9STRA|nr:unnamed protein product [Cylindrotheca closterium]CAJ1947548.1 unnamed protein product [Cylindrotheca closterium]